MPVFFLLSAFLLTELLFREKENTGRVHVGSFYIRRVLRIWPLYFAALGIGWIQSGISGGTFEGIGLRKIVGIPFGCAQGRLSLRSE
ncbi:MAG: acyltransferase family protein [Acidobacteriaceae bacterium]